MALDADDGAEAPRWLSGRSNAPLLCDANERRRRNTGRRLDVAGVPHIYTQTHNLIIVGIDVDVARETAD